MLKFLKFSFLITFSFLIFSCSSDDSEPNPINPPEWIIGTWKNNVESTFNNKYTFSNHNIIRESLNGNQTNYSELLNFPGRSLVEFVRSSSEYNYLTSLPTLQGDNASTGFSFIRLSSTELSFSENSDSVTYTSTFTKQ